MIHNPPFRKIQSFVRRNRNFTDSQQQLYTNNYAVWGIDSNQQPWNFADIFKNNHKIILEIGFGNGSTLLQDAANNPDDNYVGIEVFRSGIFNILSHLGQPNNAVKNLRVCEGDAKEILIINILDKSLDAVHIYFSDPWPKKKHHKRRLINSEFVELLASKIKSSGYVHFATDWQDYAKQMELVLTTNPKYIKHPNLDNLSKLRRLTKFESRGLKKGHSIFDFIFQII
jgi:tRNA (guanine-N7-)-methyltransferase